VVQLRYVILGLTGFLLVAAVTVIVSISREGITEGAPEDQPLTLQGGIVLVALAGAGLCLLIVIVTLVARLLRRGARIPP
jgi:uncharacterized membrane protein YphA (DoxX/SURF4 family)